MLHYLLHILIDFTCARFHPHNYNSRDDSWSGHCLLKLTGTFNIYWAILYSISPVYNIYRYMYVK